ncbi:MULTISPECIES: hypothetical protein [Bradyrhizobium]|uniref:hypothetical protein n=1 Tax=Bradyrhizobium TaxID=374 RepID=UPI00040969C0|nr:MULTISPECIES: hypothetical protein [Bradyrhizobium]UFW46270.1 hypothetical protein BaraCB756_28625 [Bradyrhizobium arachidis]
MRDVRKAAGAAANRFAALDKSSYDDVDRHSAKLFMDEMQMPAEWKIGPAGGHFLDTGIFRLETFFYEDAWRWCVVSGTDDVEAQGVADDQAGAKSNAVAWARAHLTTALRRLR